MHIVKLILLLFVLPTLCYQCEYVLGVIYIHPFTFSSCFAIMCYFPSAIVATSEIAEVMSS